MLVDVVVELEGEVEVVVEDVVDVLDVVEVEVLLSVEA